MRKINSYILVLIAGIISGAFLNFYFFSSLQIDIYIKNLIWITILAGILGGTVNYLLNQTNEFSSGDCLKNIIIGLVASALVPLFLNMLSSDLIGSIRGTDKTPSDPYKYLVFFGFCLIAAVSSRAFIQNLSDRILSEVKEANENSKEAKEKAEDAKKKAAELEESVEPIVDKETEADNSSSILEMSFSPKVLSEITDQDDADKKILTALTEGQTTFRSKSGIKNSSGINGKELDDKLFNLEEKGLIKTRESKNGLRWYITQNGRIALGKNKES